MCDSPACIGPLQRDGYENQTSLCLIIGRISCVVGDIASSRRDIGRFDGLVLNIRQGVPGYQQLGMRTMRRRQVSVERCDGLRLILLHGSARERVSLGISVNLYCLACVCCFGQVVVKYYCCTVAYSGYQRPKALKSNPIPDLCIFNARHGRSCA